MDSPRWLWAIRSGNPDKSEEDLLQDSPSRSKHQQPVALISKSFQDQSFTFFGQP